MPKSYDKKFKLEAVRMASEPGVTAGAVEKRLGIGQGGSVTLEAPAGPPG
jgi:transposase-like protein